MSEIITKSKLVEDFKKMGIMKNDTIMLHSSLKSVGWVEDGANTVLDALLEVLGEEGTLAVPTYTYSYARREGAVPYDKRNTPSETGIITETLWRRKTSERSDCPTHSIGAIGKHARFLTTDHPDKAPFGIDSPLHKLSGLGGKILLLGVGNDRNSLIHVGEIVADVKYNTVPFKESWGRYGIRVNGRNEEELVMQELFPGCSYNFGVMEDVLSAKGIVKAGKAGNAVTLVMKAQEVLDEVVRMLEHNPGFLLCHRSECECCTNRRKLLENA